MTWASVPSAMNKYRVIKALLLGLAIASVSFAGVENSHHDMRVYDKGSEKNVCMYCHISYKTDANEGLFERKGSYPAEIGSIGAFCYACHDGTVVPTARIEAPDGTLGIEALTKSHGYSIGNMYEATSGLEGTGNIARSGLVVVDSATGDLPATLECTNCHDPHSNRYPPFLRAPLESLCTKCHSGSDMLGKGRYTELEDTGADNGSHPIDMAISYSGAERKWPERTTPEMVFGTVAAQLQVVAWDAQALTSPYTHWQTGGHLIGSSETDAAAKVTCSTCHSAHSVRDDLLILDTYDLQDAVDPLCTGCHSKDEKPANPGGTSFYHPAQIESGGVYATSTTPSRELDILIPAQWPVGRNGELLCSTCHRVHQAREGTMGLRDADEYFSKYICDVCHLPNADSSPKNSHHITSWENLVPMLGGRSLSWNTGPDEPGDLANGLTCIDCHSKLARSAHNW